MKTNDVIKYYLKNAKYLRLSQLCDINKINIRSVKLVLKSKVLERNLSVYSRENIDT